MSDKPIIVYSHVDNLGERELGCYRDGILRGAPTPRNDIYFIRSLNNRTKSLVTAAF